MRTMCVNSNRLAQPFRAILALSLLVLGSGAAMGQTAPKSPVGLTWDCVISGARNGLAYLTFSDDGTFSGYEILVPKVLGAPSTQTNLLAGDIGTNGLGFRPPATPGA